MGFDDEAKMVRRSKIFLVVVLASLILLIIFMFASLNSNSNSVSALSNSNQDYYLALDPDESSLKGELNYGVIIDAGSSGSRLFVYVWPQHSGKSGDLIRIEPLKDSSGYPVVKKLSPGLSSFGPKPHNASTYMFELLDFATSRIPKNKHKETSLFILATAGLRLIPDSESNAILKNLREEIPKHYEFIVMDSHIEIISGKWEGIYSWIAVNYALKRFDSKTPSLENIDLVPIFDPVANETRLRKRTVGMIDMGGGSVQIAFETFDKVPRMQEHLIQELNLGCDEDNALHKYRLYVTTFLGFGANIAIDRYESWLRDENAGKPVIQDPCLPKSLVKSVIFSSNTTVPSYIRKGIGDFEQCQKNLKYLLNTNAPCSDNPCSFNGVFQPFINHTSLEIFGFSEYWYTTDDILQVSGDYNSDKFKDAASRFCSTSWSVLKRRLESKVYPKADQARLRTQCFKSAWISAVLHDGFGLPKNTTKFKSVSLINGQEVQWTLGALLYRLRHFPLRELQRLKELQVQSPHRRNGYATPHVSYYFIPSDNVFHILLFICIFVVVFAAVKYFMSLNRLKLARNGKPYRNNTSMTRNKSLMSYMMLDEDETSDGFNLLKNVRVEQSSYVY